MYTRKNLGVSSGLSVYDAKKYKMSSSLSVSLQLIERGPMERQFTVTTKVRVRQSEAHRTQTERPADLASETVW